ncbi:hypothetical protein SAY86_019510 [Trapa natans]|uniref:Transcription factor CBF/NF-Y/archaeal histone domain-containing protein n=1 Tax=Trapa natans TaxID=22666 RepID=A0AAN7R5M1_TRANT|nr:hypothetical protein SAY86_019510 [Trapa natans]
MKIEGVRRREFLRRRRRLSRRYRTEQLAEEGSAAKNDKKRFVRKNNSARNGKKIKLKEIHCSTSSSLRFLHLLTFLNPLRVLIPARARPLDDMKKKLDTRFPAARIKKIMQADEDVGKIAMAVPLLVSKALELFLQDLCDHTYEITLKRGAKTLNSLHLKQCVQNFNVFDFLRETVSKVPELGGSETTPEDHSASAIKRRKVMGNEENYSNNEMKRNHTIETGQSTTNGRGQGRGRGRGRGSRVSTERDVDVRNDNLVNNQDSSKSDVRNQDAERKDSIIIDNELKETTQPPVLNFDLNMDLDENGDFPDVLSVAPAIAADSDLEVKHEEFHGWSFAEVERMAVNTMRLTNLSRTVEEDEDYDKDD